MRRTGTLFAAALALAASGPAVLAQPDHVFAVGENRYGQLGIGENTWSPSPSLLGDGTAIATGESHSLAIDSEGRVWAWGSNYFGVLGDGTTISRSSPVAVTGLAGEFTAVAAGEYHSLALRSDGAIFAWGYNSSGQLGDGTTTSHSSAVPLTGVTGVFTAIAGGADHSLALKSDGTVWAWGFNGDGELGDGTTISRSTPAPVQGLLGVFTAIAAGQSHSLALRSDGTVWTWGYNNYGQLGDGTTTRETLPVQVTALTGTVITAIGAGYSHTLAVTAGGTVRAWGNNGDGQLGDGTKNNYRTTPVAVIGLTGSVIRAVSGGYSHSLARASDGRLWAWGDNLYGKLGDGTTIQRLTPVQVAGVTGGTTAIAVGEFHNLALMGDGRIWAWGDNMYGQLGSGKTSAISTRAQTIGLTGIAAIAGGGSRSLVLTEGGAVWTCGALVGDGTTNNRSSPVPVPLTGVFTAIAGGDSHSLAVRNDGLVWAWGFNGYGQLGDGTGSAYQYSPVQVTGLSGATAVSGGCNHSLAVANGTVRAWGYNWDGELGDGTTTEQHAPVSVVGLTGVFTAVAAGWHHSLALRNDGTVWAWGSNSSGQLGNGTTTSSLTPVRVTSLSGTFVTAISAGSTHNLALDDDGTVWSWGGNTNGQLGNGSSGWGQYRTVALPVSGLTGVFTAVAAGGDHSHALAADGTVWAWGANNGSFEGALGDGTTTLRVLPVQVIGLTGVTAIAAGSYHSLFIAPCLADLDGDGDVDSEDSALFAACLGAPDGEPAGDCMNADFDADGDVDLADYAYFQAHLGE